MKNRDTIVFLLGIPVGFILTFVAFGMMWVGLPFPVQGLLSLGFFAAALLAARISGRFSIALTSLSIGALPVAALFVQFRNSNNSHLGPILIVTGWFAGIFIGAWLGQMWARKRLK